MKFINQYSKFFRLLLPNPLSIALLLTVFTFLIAFIFTEPVNNDNQFFSLFSYWENGLWNNGLIVFAFQMMLMLVLGHILALTKPVAQLINVICRYATSNAKAAVLVTLFTVLVSLFNWGLGLIFGAIISRKIGEFAYKKRIPLNYPLIGAAGYSGLMVWHGGISGSSLIKVAEEGHLTSLLTGIVNQTTLDTLPHIIPLGDTVFSAMNLTAIFLVVLLLPLSMYFIALKTNFTPLGRLKLLVKMEDSSSDKEMLRGAERLDHSLWFIKFFGLMILLWVLYKTITSHQLSTLGFINPNYINLSLLALCLLFHSNIISFLKAGEKAITGTIGILIQFPLYFGIMGIMKGSGLVSQLSGFFIEISTETTLPLFTLISAGIVNIFVPSGGGQWAVQGPVIIQAAEAMNVSLSKVILALAYGDQLTNMLQPFWALPLLGITKLKAKEILPYTLYLMSIGVVIYVSILLIF